MKMTEAADGDVANNGGKVWAAGWWRPEASATYEVERSKALSASAYAPMPQSNLWQSLERGMNVTPAQGDASSNRLSKLLPPPMLSSSLLARTDVGNGQGLTMIRNIPSDPLHSVVHEASDASHSRLNTSSPFAGFCDDARQVQEFHSRSFKPREYQISGSRTVSFSSAPGTIRRAKLQERCEPFVDLYPPRSCSCSSSCSFNSSTASQREERYEVSGYVCQSRSCSCSSMGSSADSSYSSSYLHRRRSTPVVDGLPRSSCKVSTHFMNSLEKNSLDVSVSSPCNSRDEVVFQGTSGAFAFSSCGSQVTQTASANLMVDHSPMRQGGWSKHEAFEVGQRVQCRDAGEFWLTGVVTSISPLMVLPEDSNKSFEWEEVRALETHFSAELSLARSRSQLQHSDPEAFVVGQRVQCREAGEMWLNGHVTSLSPLMVSPDDHRKSFEWQEVRACPAESVTLSYTFPGIDFSRLSTDTALKDAMIAAIQDVILSFLPGCYSKSNVEVTLQEGSVAAVVRVFLRDGAEANQMQKGLSHRQSDITARILSRVAASPRLGKALVSGENIEVSSLSSTIQKAAAESRAAYCTDTPGFPFSSSGSSNEGQDVVETHPLGSWNERIGMPCEVDMSLVPEPVPAPAEVAWPKLSQDLAAEAAWSGLSPPDPSEAQGQESNRQVIQASLCAESCPELHKTPLQALSQEQLQCLSEDSDESMVSSRQQSGSGGILPDPKYRLTQDPGGSRLIDVPSEALSQEQLQCLSEDSDESMLSSRRPSASGSTLPDPKYGIFQDPNGSGLPDVPSEALSQEQLQCLSDNSDESVLSSGRTSASGSTVPDPMYRLTQNPGGSRLPDVPSEAPEPIKCPSEESAASSSRSPSMDGGEPPELQQAPEEMGCPLQTFEMCMHSTSLIDDPADVLQAALAPVSESDDSDLLSDTALEPSWAPPEVFPKSYFLHQIELSRAILEDAIEIVPHEGSHDTNGSQRERFYEEDIQYKTLRNNDDDVSTVNHQYRRASRTSMSGFEMDTQRQPSKYEGDDDQHLRISRTSNSADAKDAQVDSSRSEGDDNSTVHGQYLRASRASESSCDRNALREVSRSVQDDAPTPEGQHNPASRMSSDTIFEDLAASKGSNGIDTQRESGIETANFAIVSSNSFSEEFWRGRRWSEELFAQNSSDHAKKSPTVKDTMPSVQERPRKLRTTMPPTSNNSGSKKSTDNSSSRGETSPGTPKAKVAAIVPGDAKKAPSFCDRYFRRSITSSGRSSTTSENVPSWKRLESVKTACAKRQTAGFNRASSDDIFASDDRDSGHLSISDRRAIACLLPIATEESDSDFDNIFLLGENPPRKAKHTDLDDVNHIDQQTSEMDSDISLVFDNEETDEAIDERATTDLSAAEHTGTTSLGLSEEAVLRAAISSNEDEAGNQAWVKKKWGKPRPPVHGEIVDSTSIPSSAHEESSPARDKKVWGKPRRSVDRDDANSTSIKSSAHGKSFQMRTKKTWGKRRSSADGENVNFSNVNIPVHKEHNSVEALPPPVETIVKKKWGRAKSSGGGKEVDAQAAAQKLQGQAPCINPSSAIATPEFLRPAQASKSCELGPHAPAGIPPAGATPDMTASAIEADVRGACELVETQLGHLRAREFASCFELLSSSNRARLGSAENFAMICASETFAVLVGDTGERAVVGLVNAKSSASAATVRVDVCRRPRFHFDVVLEADGRWRTDSVSEVTTPSHVGIDDGGSVGTFSVQSPQAGMEPSEDEEESGESSEDEGESEEEESEEQDEDDDEQDDKQVTEDDKQETEDEYRASQYTQNSLKNQHEDAEEEEEEEEESEEEEEDEDELDSERQR